MISIPNNKYMYYKGATLILNVIHVKTKYNGGFLLFFLKTLPSYHISSNSCPLLTNTPFCIST